MCGNANGDNNALRYWMLCTVKFSIEVKEGFKWHTIECSAGSRRAQRLQNGGDVFLCYFYLFLYILFCFFIMFICVIKFNIIIENKSLSYIQHSKLNPFHPLSLPRSVMLKLSLKKKINLNFTLPIKKGIIYINISKEGKHLKLFIHINFSICWNSYAIKFN